MNARGHAAQLRQEHHRVDTGPLKADELAGRLRPVLAPHQHGQDFAAEVAAELAGRPARRRLLPPVLAVLAEFRHGAGEAFPGGAADRVRGCS
ncbi:hypothetical protein [Streptomyces sp. NBC_01207]|uniref:hypothetical protein n=1 Tax=Streptomyces sp. NBC_01207 TaxID=2903772 RepID=UPI002E167B9C|nr:hypothetical protein OG457_01695 [Streptomyces sp. NBC_01207]